MNKENISTNNHEIAQLNIVGCTISENRFLTLTLHSSDTQSKLRLLAQIPIPTADLMRKRVTDFKEQMDRLSEFFDAVGITTQPITELDFFLGRQCWAIISNETDNQTGKICRNIVNFITTPSSSYLNRKNNYVVTRKTTTRGAWTYNIYGSKLHEYSKKSGASLVIVGDYELPTQKIIVIPIKYFSISILPYIETDSRDRYTFEVDRETLHITWRYGYHMDGSYYLQRE